MVHAKAAVGFDAAGGCIALLGSANMKTRSFTQFGELLAISRGGPVATALACELQTLAAEAAVVQLQAPSPSQPPSSAAIERADPWALALGALLRHGRSSRVRFVPGFAAFEEWAG
jgi:hypothetical protein